MDLEQLIEQRFWRQNTNPDNLYKKLILDNTNKQFKSNPSKNLLKTEGKNMIYFLTLELGKFKSLWFSNRIKCSWQILECVAHKNQV